MQFAFEKYIGIHPGLILERELKKRHIKKRPFAIAVGEYPQLINEVTKGRRGITPTLSLKMDHELGLEPGTLYLLQAHYDLEKARKVIEQATPPKFRPELFWDTDVSQIDWKRQYKAVVTRVFQRGDKEEKAEAIRYYGNDKIRGVIGETGTDESSLPIFNQPKK